MYMYIVYIHVRYSTAVSLGVFGGFITQSLPIIAGYEWRQSSHILLLLVGQLFVVMKRLMNLISSHVMEHYGSPYCKAGWCARQAMRIPC